jgi:hypothetical protein
MEIRVPTCWSEEAEQRRPSGSMSAKRPAAVSGAAALVSYPAFAGAVPFAEHTPDELRSCRLSGARR